MAQLSETLPTVTDSYEKIITPPKPAPSFLEAIADFGSAAIQAQERGAANFAEGQRKRALAAKTSAENDAARGAVLAMFGTDDQPTIDAYNAASQAAPALKNQQTAAAQGRAVNPAAVGVRSEAVIRQLVANHPGQEYTILKTLKEFGIDSYAMKEYERANAAIDAKITEDNREEQKLADSALELGLGVWKDMKPDERAAAIPIILKHNEAMAKLEQADKLATMTLTQTNITEAQKKEAEKTEGELRFRGFADAMGPRFDTFLKSVTQIITDPSLSPTERDANVAKLTAFADVELPRQFNQALSLYGQKMTGEQVTQLTSMFTRTQDALHSLLSGPASEVEKSKRQVELLQNAANIDVMKALPFWNYMKQALGTETLGVLFSNEILSNPDVQKRLQNEFKAASDLAPGEDRLRMQNVVDILKGNVDLKSLSNPQADAPVVLKTMNAMAGQTTIWNGTDSQSHEEFMNAIRNVAGVAVEANAGWGRASLMQIGASLSNRNVFRGMAVTSTNKEERSATINAWQPAAEAVLNGLKQTDPGDKFYNIVFTNTKFGPQFELQWNGKKQFSNIPEGQRIRTGLNNPAFAQKPTPSTEAVRQVNLMNSLLGQQTQLAKHGWDPMVSKDSPEAEIRKFYATGEPTKAMREEAKAEKSKTPSGQESIDSLMKSLIDSFNASPEFQTGDIGSKITGAENTTGNPAATNPKSSATGDGQFTKDTWLDTIKAHRPDLARGKSDEELLAMRSDPTLSKEMTVAYAGDNKEKLANAGVPTDDGALYLAHFLGPGGAGKVLQASTGAIEVLTLAQDHPDVPITMVLPQKVLSANDFLLKQGINTVGKLVEWARKKMGG